jgi:hypothetical protein
MPLLQPVTFALLLHFSRLLLISSSRRSFEFWPKQGSFSLPAISMGILATCFFTVTTVTNKIKTLLKSATAKDLKFVTATCYTPIAVTFVLQSVTSCNIHCYKVVTFSNIYKSISYKVCNSWPLKNLYLRIFHSKNKINYYHGHKS